MMTETDLAPMGRGLDVAPVFDQVDRRRLELIQKTAAKGLSETEVGAFLELAAKYDLDPFAHEIWGTKGRGKDGEPGRLLIMVGRDGLRKIAARNGLIVDCDVVRLADTFKVHRKPDGERVVEHSYSGGIEKRGEIIGAWAEVRERSRRFMAQTVPGAALGFFYAPLSEYRPTSEKKLQFSPWGAQESVMILAAAERQALRQATPLSGLLVEGEADRNAEMAEGATPDGSLIEQVTEWAPTPELGEQIVDTLAEAAQLGHAGLADIGTMELTLKGRDAAAVEAWLVEADKELAPLRDAAEAEEPGDAVESTEGDSPPVPSIDDDPEAKAEADRLWEATRAEEGGS